MTRKARNATYISLSQNPPTNYGTKQRTKKMSDDWGLSHWFRDDDDWLQSLVATIRDSVVNPSPVTFGQLSEFMDELASAAQRTKSNVDLRTLEATARSFDMADLPAASLLGLVGITEEEAGRGRAPGKMLGNVPLSHVSSMLRPKTGRLRVSDVVAIAKLAAKQANASDVFEGLDPNSMADSLSRRVLGACTLTDLRATLEGLCASGVIVRGKAAG